MQGFFFFFFINEYQFFLMNVVKLRNINFFLARCYLRSLSYRLYLSIYFCLSDVCLSERRRVGGERWLMMMVGRAGVEEKEEEGRGGEKRREEEEEIGEKEDVKEG